MKKTRSIIFVVLVIAILGVISWTVLWNSHPEPVYNGKSLSQWLDTYNPTSGTSELMNEAKSAIFQMDTNAIPTLLRILETRDTPAKLWFIHLAEKQRLFRVHHVPEMTRYMRAAAGFVTLGNRGHGAIPELIQIYDRNLSSNSQQVVAYILGSMGPAAKAAVPSLLRELNSTNLNVRLCAASALGQIQSEPEKVVPALTKMVQNDKTTRGFDAAVAAAALGQFGSAAKPAVPALLEYLTNHAPPTVFFGQSGFSYAQMVLGSLQQIDPAAAAKFNATNNASLER